MKTTKQVNITDLVLNKENPKLDYQEDDQAKKEYERLKSSLQKHGQIEPILVRIDPDDKKHHYRRDRG